MRTLIRTGSTVAWLGLVALTSISWFLGTDHRFNSANHAWASVAIFVVAVFKLRLVGMYFMELRGAPRAPATSEPRVAVSTLSSLSLLVYAK
jgi:hypothetical protein